MPAPSLIYTDRTNRPKVESFRSFVSFDRENLLINLRLKLTTHPAKCDSLGGDVLVDTILATLATKPALLDATETVE